MTQHIGRVLAALAVLASAPTPVSAQGTAFAYQGRLNEGGSPATGLYDLRFGLYNVPEGGAALGGLLTNTATPVNNGLFGVILDFGNQFSGAARWLEIGVRTNGGGPFALLTPRQSISSAPHAVRAIEAAGVPAGTVTSAMLADGAVTRGKIAAGAVSQLGASDGSPAAALQVNADGLIGLGVASPAAGLDIAASKEAFSLEALSTRRDELGGYMTLQGAWDVVAQGNLVAVAAAGESGITLLDISNPSAPALRSQFRDGDGAFTNLAGIYRLAMKPNLLLAAASGDSAVTFIGIADPANPVKLAELRDGVGGFDGLANVSVAAVSGNLAALGSAAEGAVTLVDISNPSLPAKRAEIRNGVGGFNRLSAIESLAVEGNLLAIGSSSPDRTITLVDVSNPTSPLKRAELVGGAPGYEALGRLTGLAMSGGLLAAASQTGEAVTLVDVSNPASPVRRAVLQQGVNSSSLYGVVAVALSSSRLFAGGRAAVSVWDVSNPASPLELGTARNTVGGIQTLDDVWGVAIAGSNYVATSALAGDVTVLGLRGHASSLVTAGWVGIGVSRPQAALHTAGNVRVDNAERVELNTDRFEAGSSTLASGFGSTALGYISTASGSYSTALGYGSTAEGMYSTAMGGGRALGSRSLALGHLSSATGAGAVSVGSQTLASGRSSTALGESTSASGSQSLAAGQYSLAAGDLSMALGYANQATGRVAFALGSQAAARHDNSFVWNDGVDAWLEPFSSTAANQFLVKAVGGVGINTNNPTGAALAVRGNVTVDGVLRGDGAGLSNVTAATLDGLPGASFWKTSGNTGANPANGVFLGTADSQPLEFKVNGQRALRLQPSRNSPNGRSPSLVGGHASNALGADFIGATIVGGGNSNFPNRVENDYASVLGGLGNRASGFGSTAMGVSTLAAHDAAVAMGHSVSATNYYATAMGFSTVAGGYSSTAMGAETLAHGSWSVALGYRAAAMHDGAFVWADAAGAPFTSTANNQFLIRATGGVGIGTATPGASLQVAGGVLARGGAPGALGFNNNGYAFAGNGGDNDSGMFSSADGQVEFYGNGFERMRIAAGGNIGVGTPNPQTHLHVYSANNPTIVRVQSTGTPGFGRLEFVSNPQGDGNEWRPAYIQSTDAGGFKGGLSVVVNGAGSANKFGEVEAMRIQEGRVGIGTSAPGDYLQVVNATCNGATWNNASDRNLKESFRPVDGQEMLARVAALPIESWSYTNEPGRRHIGPTAQDFQAAFGLNGADNTHIATVDADGVALAAIQGLNQKVEALNDQVQRREAENAQLKQRLERLEALLARLPR